MGNCRNHTLEMLKLCVAYMVVFLHVPFYGTFGVALNALARFAVPFFFLISGFFSYGITREKIRRRIAHVVFLLAFAWLICTASNMALLVVQHGFRGILLFFRQYLDPEKIFNFLLFNKTIQVEYLWYLFALLYVYVLFYITSSLHVKDKAYWVVSLLGLCLNLFLGEFLSLFGIALPNYYLRNFALLGVPFFGLGMLASKYRQKLDRVPDAALVAAGSIGIVETLVSRFSFGINELHIGSVLILFSLVAVFIKYPNVSIARMLTPLAGCNTYIYILHPIVSSALVSMYALLGVNSAMKGYIALRMIHPLIVCVISTILALGLNRIMPRVERRINHCGAA